MRKNRLPYQTTAEFKTSREQILRNLFPVAVPFPRETMIEAAKEVERLREQGSVLLESRAVLKSVLTMLLVQAMPKLASSPPSPSLPLAEAAEEFLDLYQEPALAPVAFVLLMHMPNPYEAVTFITRHAGVPRLGRNSTKSTDWVV